MKIIILEYLQTNLIHLLYKIKAFLKKYRKPPNAKVISLDKLIDEIDKGGVSSISIVVNNKNIIFPTNSLKAADSIIKAIRSELYETFTNTI